MGFHVSLGECISRGPLFLHPKYTRLLILGEAFVARSNPQAFPCLRKVVVFHFVFRWILPGWGNNPEP